MIYIWFTVSLATIVLWIVSLIGAIYNLHMFNKEMREIFRK